MATETTRRVVVNREHPPNRLSVIVRDPDGQPIKRWAEDEAKVENVLGSLTKTGDMPGGHGELGCVLARDPKQSWPDLASFSTIELQAAGGEKLWQGTLRQQPQSDGDHISISPKAVGDKQFLEDDEGAVNGFINADMSRWAGPSVRRRIELDKAGSPNQTDPQVIADPTGQPALQLEVSGKWESPIIPRCEANFIPKNGVTIGRLLANFASGGSTGAETNFILAVSVGSEPVGDVFTAASGTIDHTTTTPQYAVQLEWQYNATPAGADGAQYSVRLYPVVVIGSQGLALHWDGTGYGFTAAQMIPHIVEGSGLTTKAELLDDDEFVIGQAWFDEPGTRMSQLVEVTKYGLYDWFVLNDRILQYKAPGTYGRTWVMSAGNAPQDSGPDANRVWDELIVTWQDVDGSTKSIGPEGSGATYSDNRLRETDPRNAAVAAGRPRRKLLVLNEVSTATLALATGERFLEEVNRLDQSGTATLTGYVQGKASKAWYPTAYVQPGDRLFEPATGLERKITNVSYTGDSESASVTLGAPPEGLSALEARFNARLIELGFGT